MEKYSPKRGHPTYSVTFSGLCLEWVKRIEICIKNGLYIVNWHSLTRSQETRLSH